MATLNLSDNSMASLNVDLFDGLVGLTALDLSGNSITGLTAGVFDGLDDSLTSLYLRSNRLASLPADIFDGLTGLTGLDLSCNSLTALELARFDPFALTLTFLEISGNLFTTPPTETALRAKLPNARYLYTGTNTLCGPPDDTAITGLSISPGSTPEGDPLGTAFAMVGHDVSKTTVTLTARDPNTEIVPYSSNNTPLYDDDRGMPGWQVRLPTYRNDFQWQVRSKNGTIGAANSLIVYRSHPTSSEARLYSLEMSGVTLAGTFDEDNYLYMATTATSETIVTATPLDPDATTVIKLNGRVDADGNVDLEMGSNNVITVEVTAEDGTTTEIYTVTVTRTPPEVTLPAPRLPAEDDPQAVWLATLTVASLSSNQYGYDSTQCGRGGLTDTAFTYLGDNTPISQSQSFTKEGTLYTVDKAYYFSGGFHLSLDQQFAQQSADNIFVDVGGAHLRFSDATYASSPHHTYQWITTDPSWSAGDQVPLKILVLKNADGPDGLVATTTLTLHTGPSGHKYETRNLTLTWSAPTSGGAVTGYRVEYQPDPAFQWQTLVASQPGTTYTQSGKLRDVVDYYRVAALRSGEPASYSDMVRVQVPPDTPKVPQRVSHVEAGPAACSALKVAWNRADTRISKNGNGVGSGVRATGYQVQYAPEGLTWRNWSGPIEQIEFKERRQRSPDLKTVITGLAPNRDYQVRLRSCNDAGCAEWTTPTLAKAGMAAANVVAKAVEAQLTVSLESAPEAHDGESGFQVQIAFSEDVEITPEDMRDHALVVTGGTVTDAAMVKGRKDLWKLTVEPAGLGPVSILAPQDRACTETGALCTADGRSLTVSLALQVPGPPAQQANSPATGAPAIRGTPQVGEMLTADTSGITDADGLTNATYTYQWVANDGTTDTDISGATDAAYPLVADDKGKTIKVRVTITDDAGNETTLTSAATEAVAAAEPPAKPTGLSAAVSHDTVTLTWDDPQDDSVTGYVILRRDRAIHLVGTFVTIAGDTGSADTTYTDTTVEPDKQYVYRIKAINEHREVSERSDWVRGFTPAAPPTDSPATGQPAISGTAQVGETLRADTSGIADEDGLTNAVYSYQWLSSDAEIGGATGSTYTLLGADEGQTIKVRVIVTDDLGNETTLTSAATTEVAPKPNTPATGEPTISGTVQVSQTLTADTSAITDADGLTNVSYSYQWVVTDGGAYIDISGETGATYTLVSADRGLYILVRVSFTDDAGKRETLTSAATDVVAAAP